MPHFNPTEFQKRLAAWFRKNQREMPWRKAENEQRDPYAVVVSEVMLQQTQVTTVIPYFQRWMTLFPTFQALADAPQDKVLKAWEGLGYYSRARNLHKLAQIVVTQLGGQLPSNVDALLTLPGIGPYSARSIASLAFGTAAACVDGNVVRVLSRLQNIDTPYKSAAAAQLSFQKIADGVLNHAHPGLHNEAMMEFGATVCTKMNPRCTQCPMSDLCQAYAAGRQEELPRFEAKKIESKLVKRVWVSHEGRLLLHRGKAATGVLEGLYELPTPEHLRLKRLPAKELLRRVRNITKYKITEVIYKVSKIDNLLPLVEKDPTLRWATPTEIKELPLSGPHAQWIEELLGRKTNRP